MQGKRVNPIDSRRTWIRCRDGGSRGGHLLKAIVRTTLEINLSEIPDHSKRRMHKDINITSIDIS